MLASSRRVEIRPIVSHPDLTAILSHGDVADRMTILDLKAQRLGSPEARASARRLLTTWRRYVGDWDFPDDLVLRLSAINAALWDAEVEIRSMIRANLTAEIARAASAIVLLNDERHSVKTAIDRRAGAVARDDKDYLSRSQDR